MINREFYRFREVVERLGTDAEALRQAVTLEKLTVFLELKAQAAELISGDCEELDKKDPYCTWFRRSPKPRQDADQNKDISKFNPTYVLSGWFELGASDAIIAAQYGSPTFDMAVAPSFANKKLARRSPEFSVTIGDESFVEVAWFLASEIDALTQPDALKSTKWPWGDHETQLLRDLAAAAKEWWSTYDPEKPGTAPTNDKVTQWLINERQVADRNARVIATMLRADNLKDGPRPRR